VQQGGGAAGGHDDAVLGQGGFSGDGKMAQTGVEAVKQGIEKV
jgi:hypothetical protein